MDLLLTFINNFLSVFAESAPWLILGFFIAGIIKAFIPADFLAKHLGGDNVTSVVKASLFGAPLPLCSCGVIPAALGLHRSGASKAATTSFLISTPETGVDSISITYALLGPFMAIIRPIAAVSTAITAGLLVLISKDSDEVHTNQTPQNPDLHANQSNDLNSCCEPKQVTAQPSATSGCCSSKTPVKTTKTSTSDCCSSKQVSNIHSAVTTKPAEKSCCGSEAPSKTTAQEDNCCATANNANDKTNSTLINKLADGLHFTFVDLIKDIALWLLIGLALAALILTLVPAEFLATWGSSPYAYVLMAAIGVPMYICATSSTPIAAGLLFAGVSPGAVLVFLLVGPATNIATMGVVKSELGSKVLAIYLATVVGLGFVFGWLTDYVADVFNITTASPSVQSHIHNMTDNPIIWVSSIVLAALLLNGLRLKWLK